MDRIHRLGQHRPVKAIKLVVEDSIESRIVQVTLVALLPDRQSHVLSVSFKRKNQLWWMLPCPQTTQCVSFHLLLLF